MFKPGIYQNSFKMQVSWFTERILCLCVLFSLPVSVSIFLPVSFYPFLSFSALNSSLTPRTAYASNSRLVFLRNTFFILIPDF
jgi:hypothetical protein